MADNFATVHPWVLAHEGGYVNHKDDPGGATSQGVTQATYDAARKRWGQAPRSVRYLDPGERDRIYKVQYWDKVRGDELPSGVDYAVYDFAVNSGPARAAKFLQRIVGVAQDGIVGINTVAAVDEWCAAHGAAALVRALCDARLAWLKRLRHWSTFGRGWSRRVGDVRAKGVDLAAGHAAVETPAPDHSPRPVPRPEGKERIDATVKDALAKPGTWGALIGSGGIGALAPLIGDSLPLQIAVAVCLVGIVGAGIVWAMRRGQAT